MTPPRFELATLPTPLVRARRLEARLATGPLYVKRDDLTGFALAGNKARALEFLVGAAVADGCDLLVAAGSPTSNLCAAAALAARIAGLDCDLLFAGPQPPGPSVNIALANAAGARLRFNAVATRDELDGAVVEYCEAIRAEGRRPYGIPRGGATAVGAVGYAYAAHEFAEQCDHAGIAAGTVVVATGSGASQAGLVAGLVGSRLKWRVVGASVSRPRNDLVDQILTMSRACAAGLDLREPDVADVDVRDVRGAGFGIASAEDRISSELASTHEGLLLDDYYGAKAMTLFRSLLGSGTPTPAVFWHTGGLVAALAALTAGAMP